MSTINEDHAPKNAHVDTDNKDQTTLANRVEAEKAREKAEKEAEQAPKPDPTEAALSHGNQPSKGAIIDSTLEQEEAAELAKKDEAKRQSQADKKH